MRFKGNILVNQKEIRSTSLLSSTYYLFLASTTEMIYSDI